MGAVTERRVSLALPRDGTLKPGHDLELGRFQLGGDRVHSVLVRDPNLPSLFGSNSLLLPCPRESLRLSARMVHSPNRGYSEPFRRQCRSGEPSCSASWERCWF